MVANTILVLVWPAFVPYGLGIAVFLAVLILGTLWSRRQTNRE